MLAADHNGEIPESPTLIKKLCFMDSVPDMKVFVSHGFIDGCRQDDANLAPTRRQDVAPEENRIEENILSDLLDFEKLWASYPKKDGKKEAERHFRASVQSEKQWGEINQALANYLRHVKGKELQYVKNGSTWFNNWQDWVVWKGDQNGPNSRSSFGDRLFEQKDGRKLEEGKVGGVPKLFS